MSHHCCQVFLVTLILGLVPSGHTSPSSPETPPGCSAWGHGTSVQVPLAMGLCLAEGNLSAAPVVLGFQDQDGNDLGRMDVSAKNDELILKTRCSNNKLKDRRHLPITALQEGCLHLGIHNNNSNSLEVFTRDGAPILDFPVGKKDSIRITLEQLHSHKAMICSPTTAAPNRTGEEKCCCNCLLAAVCLLLSVFQVTLTWYAVKPLPLQHAAARDSHTEMEVITLVPRQVYGADALPQPPPPPPLTHTHPKWQ